MPSVAVTGDGHVSPIDVKLALVEVEGARHHPSDLKPGLSVALVVDFYAERATP